MDRHDAACSKVLYTNKHRYFQRNQLKIQKLLCNIHAIFCLIMNTFIITEILQHCHSFFYFIFYFSRRFLPNTIHWKMFTVGCVCMLYVLHWATRLLHYYTSWMKHRHRFWRAELVSMYFFKLLFVCTGFKHWQSFGTAADHRLDIRWVPKHNAKILHYVYRTFPRPSPNSFQFDTHCITPIPMTQIFIIKKYTYWTWLTVMYSSRLCFFIRLLLPSTMRFAVPEFLKNWIYIQIFQTDKARPYLIKVVFGSCYKHYTKHSHRVGSFQKAW